MRKLVVPVALLLAALPAFACVTYSGSITGGGGGITAPANPGNPANPWNSTSTKLQWKVTEASGGWKYEYWLCVPAKDISHVLIEVSPTFTLRCLKGETLGGIGAFSPSDPGNSNPQLPGSIYAMKIIPDNDCDKKCMYWSFTTARNPVWGDFYAKDGVVQKNGKRTEVVMWNTGFLADDPTAGPCNGSLNGHILRPDTEEGQPPPATPELGTWMLLSASGLVGMVLHRRRRA